MTNEIRELKAKNKQLEEDIQEYKDVIDSIKQKLDAVECLCEDFKAEIAEWKLKYIAVCEKKDILEDKLENHGPNGHNITNEQFVNLRNENKALKEFILSMASQLQVIVKKL